MATSQKIPYHLRQLAHLCDEYRLIRKLVFVPSRRIGHKLAGALARSGHQWVHLHLTTPYDWAKRQVEPLLKQEGWSEITAGADRLVIEELIRETDLDTELPPDTLARTAAATLPALRLSGAEPADVSAVDGPEKVQRIVETLAERYSGYLDQHRLYDEAAVFLHAIEAMRDAPLDDLLCACLDEVQLAGRAFEYVRALVDRSRWPLQRIGRTSYGAVPPPLSAGRRLSISPVSIPDQASEVIGVGGFLWNDDSPAEAGGDLRTVQVLGQANEVRTVLREMQGREIPCDEVELVYTSETDHLRRIYSLLARYDIPATYSGGLPVASTRPGAALSLFYEWIESGFAPANLIQLLASGALERISDIDPKRAATILRRAQPGRGEDQYFSALARLERRRNEDSADPEEIERIERVRSLLRRLFALVPDRQTTTAELARSTQRFLDVFVRIREDVYIQGDEGEASIDEEAVETLVKRFTGLAGLIEGRRPRQRLVRQFREQLAHHKVADSSPRPGCMHVSDLRTAGYTNRSHVFIIGLDQSVFPGGSREDPLLLDHMRREISRELPPCGHTPAEMNWHLVRVLGMSSGETILICSRRDLVDDRPLHPSAAFLRAGRQGAGRVPPLRLLPALPDNADRVEEWLARTLLSDAELGMVLRDTAPWHEIVPIRYPWLADGRRAQEQRASDRITTYDGVITAPDGSLALSGRTLSASRLETLMTCTYRYFLRYVLDMKPVEYLRDRDSDRWLDGREFGSLLHRLFRRFMQEIVERGESVDRERHASLIEQLLQEEIKQQEEHAPPPSQAARRRDVDRLRTCARIFLAAEEDHCSDHTPAGFEVSFGQDEAAEDGFGCADPVRLHLSEDIQFRLQGRIDRVDHGPDGSYAVWDYKTGSAYGFDAYDLFSGGEKLQWALYAHALAEMTGQAVGRSGYFFPTRRTYGQRMAREVPPRQEIARLLEPLFRMVEEGYFLPAASRDHCEYCDYRGICGDYTQRRQEMRSKLRSDALDDSQKHLLQQWNYDG